MMKILQSFWSKPLMNTAEGASYSRLTAAWLHKKYNYYSWALSCLQLRNFYGHVELITDQVGKYILIDSIGLPYTKVTTALEEVSGYDPELWAVGKIYAYSVQQEPFLHVDGDIYIWKEISPSLLAGDLIAQNHEEGDHYSENLALAVEHFKYVPEYLQKLCKKDIVVEAVNAGIMGGQNIGFFKNYTREVFEFVNRNSDCIGLIDKFKFNTIFEQLIFRCLAKEQGVNIQYLFPDIATNPKDIGYIHAQAENKHYVHVIGTYKTARIACVMVELKLKTLYPEYYYRIENLLSRGVI